jgi:hypothetical protein
MNIKCKWQEINRLLVNPDGQVYPCCYLGNLQYKYGVEENDAARDSQAVMKEYNDNKEKYNIHSTDMRDIISSEWFTKTLPESWNDETRTTRQCKKWCGEEE